MFYVDWKFNEMKNIVDQIVLSSISKNKILGSKELKIKWYLVKNKNHYYEINIGQKSEVQVKSNGVIVAKRLLNDLEERRILRYIHEFNLKLPIPDSQSIVEPNIQHQLEITLGELFLSIIWSSNDELEDDLPFSSLRALTYYIESIEKINFGFVFM